MSVKAGTAVALSLSVLLWNASSSRTNDAFILSRGEAGSVKTGMTIDQLYSIVGRGRTRLVDEQLEGLFSPAIEIYLTDRQRDRPSLVAEVVGRGSGFVVGRITVYDPRFKTSKGIGVGSTLGEIRRNYKVNFIGFGEGPLVARVEQLGMSFALDARPPAKWYKSQDAKLIPNNARVIFVFLAT
jgi:hypothetical protein